MALRGAQADWDTTRITIQRPPSPRDVFWIGTFEDSKEPEFTGYHPGIIISGTKTLEDRTEFVVFVPVTSDEPRKGPRGDYPPYIHQLSENPNPGDSRLVWAICNHVMTVRISRLERYYEAGKGLVVPKISKTDFEAVLDCIANGMVVLRTRFSNRNQVEIDKLKADHQKEMADLRASVETEIENRVNEILENLTGPS